MAVFAHHRSQYLRRMTRRHRYRSRVRVISHLYCRAPGQLDDEQNWKKRYVLISVENKLI